MIVESSGAFKNLKKEEGEKFKSNTKLGSLNLIN